MRLILVHAYYQQPGGEDAAVTREHALLASHGHDICLYAAGNEKVRNVFQKVRVAWQVVYSQSARQRLAEQIAAFNPEIVHVHNFFPLLTPSIYDACLAHGVPVVQTLHNYRLICPGALLMRHGRICEKCAHGSVLQAVAHACYRKSILGTLAVARMVAWHRKHGTWHNKVSRFIALTDFCREKFIAGGLPAEKIVVKPNFVPEISSFPTNLDSSETVPRRGALFVGRLSSEKGVSTILQAWRGLQIPLRVVGDGPMFDRLAAFDHEAVSLSGRLTPAQVGAEMKRTAFLIMPSEWYETFGMVIAEAFSHGLPVIASRLGAMAEIVEDGITGLHFEAGNADDLSQKVKWLYTHPDECRRMGNNARQVCLEKYSPERNYEMLMAIYRGVLDECKTYGR